MWDGLGFRGFKLGVQVTRAQVIARGVSWSVEACLALAGIWASPSGEEAWGFRDASVDAARFVPLFSPFFFSRTYFFLRLL